MESLAAEAPSDEGIQTMAALAGKTPAVRAEAAGRLYKMFLATHKTSTAEAKPSQAIEQQSMLTRLAYVAALSKSRHHEAPFSDEQLSDMVSTGLSLASRESTSYNHPKRSVASMLACANAMQSDENRVYALGKTYTAAHMGTHAPQPALVPGQASAPDIAASLQKSLTETSITSKHGVRVLAGVLSNAILHDDEATVTAIITAVRS